SKTRPFWLIPRRSVGRPGPWLLLAQRHSVLAGEGLLPLRCSSGTSLLCKRIARAILGGVASPGEAPTATHHPTASTAVFSASTEGRLNPGCSLVERCGHSNTGIVHAVLQKRPRSVDRLVRQI